MSVVRPKIRQRGKSWQIDFGEMTRPDGKVYRERKTFKTKRDAEEELSARGFESKNHRVRLMDLSEAQRIDVLRAIKELNGAATVTDAVRFYLKHGRPATGERKLVDVANEHIEAKVRAGRRPATITDAGGQQGQRQQKGKVRGHGECSLKKGCN